MTCMKTLSESICSSPFYIRLIKVTTAKLRKSSNIDNENKDFQKMFQILMELMYCIMINVKQGSLFVMPGQKPSPFTTVGNKGLSRAQIREKICDHVRNFVNEHEYCFNSKSRRSTECE